MMKELKAYEEIVDDLKKRVTALEKLIKKMPADKPPAKKGKVKPTGE